MSGNDCINCGHPETERYDLTVRNNDHDEVPLCEGCYEAIHRELSSPQ